MIRVNAKREELISNGTKIKELFFSPVGLTEEQEISVINSKDPLSKYIKFYNKQDHKSQYLVNWVNNKISEGFEITWVILEK